MRYDFQNTSTGEIEERVAKHDDPRELTDDRGTWVRLIAMPGVIVKGDGSVKPLAEGALPVSRSLPRADKHDIIGTTKIGEHIVHELRGGGYCNQVGQRIIDGNAARDRHAGQTGYTDIGK